VLKTEFIKAIKLQDKDFESDDDYKLWFTKKKGERNSTYFAEIFKKVTSNPKHFYYKYLDALNDSHFHPTEKDDLLIHTLKDFLQLQIPKQFDLAKLAPNTKQGEKEAIKKKAALFVQLFVEAYEPTVFLEYPELQVYDRMSETFSKSFYTERQSRYSPITFKHGIIKSELRKLRADEEEIRKLISSFIDAINGKNYEFALSLVSNGYKLERYWHLTHELKNVDVGKIEINNKKAYCRIVYSEVMSVYESPDYSKIAKANLSTLDSYYDALKSYKAQLEGLGYRDFSRFYVSELFSVTHLQRLYAEEGFNIPVLEKLYPKMQLRTIRRYQVLRFLKSKKQWKIEFWYPMEINQINS